MRNRKERQGNVLASLRLLWLLVGWRFIAHLQRESRLWSWFVSALAGVLAKGFFEATQAGQPYRLSWPQAVMALVATLLTFQATFERYKDVSVDAPLLVHISLAFQSGFFWQTVFNDLTGVN